jgi:3-hydroxyisobutyrate dehydrogenase-like beta-hydroxyacid dehydrogenase
MSQSQSGAVLKELHAGTKIGLVGLGVMGLAIAKRIVSLGFRVWGRDIDPAAEARAAAIGVTIATLEQLRSMDALLISLPDDSAVTNTLLGQDGFTRTLPPGAVIVELSTVLPETVRAVGRAGAARSVRVIDCAVTGGPELAETGTLVLIVGALPRDLAETKWLLDCLGTVCHAGEVGDGKAIKLVNNTMTMGNLLVASEAFNLGVRAGIPAQRLFDILSISGGRSHQFVKRFPNFLKRDFAGRFSLRLGEKDLKLALVLAEEVGASMPATAMIRQLFSEAARLGSSDEDIVAVAKLYESLDQRVS